MKEEVKQKKIITKLLSKIGCWCVLIGVFFIIMGCILLKETVPSITYRGAGEIMFGFLLCLVGTVLQSIIEIVKTYIARNPAIENTIKNVLLSGSGCRVFLIGLCLTIGIFVLTLVFAVSL